MHLPEMPFRSTRWPCIIAQKNFNLCIKNIICINNLVSDFTGGQPEYFTKTVGPENYFKKE